MRVQVVTEEIVVVRYLARNFESVRVIGRAHGCPECPVTRDA
jgi:hypothetical protein